MFLLLETCVQRNNQFFEAKELLGGEMLSDTETDHFCEYWLHELVQLHTNSQKP